MQRPTLLLAPLLAGGLLAGCAGAQPQPSSRPASSPASRPAEEALARVAVVHGGVGPFAVAGYRMGADAVARLESERGAWGLHVLHLSPDAVQWSCIVDGLQAATGTSLGRLSLERRSGEDVESVVSLGERRLVYGLQGDFLLRYLDLPPADLEAAGREVLELPAEEVFWVREE